MEPVSTSRFSQDSFQDEMWVYQDSSRSPAGSSSGSATPKNANDAPQQSPTESIEALLRAGGSGASARKKMQSPLWHKLTERTKGIEYTYLDAITPNQSGSRCVNADIVTVTLGLDEKKRQPIHANHIAMDHLSNNNGIVSNVYLAGQSPDVSEKLPEYEHFLVQGIESGQGMFQFVSRLAHRHPEKSKEKPIIHQLRDKLKDQPNLIIGNGRYRIQELNLEPSSNPPSSKSDHLTYQLKVTDLESNTDLIIPLTQAGLKYSDSVLAAKEIHRASDILTNHNSLICDGEKAATQSQPLIVSYAGIGRNATLITYREIAARIASGDVTTQNLDDALEKVILAGRVARGPGFVQSNEQLEELRHALLDRCVEVESRLQSETDSNPGTGSNSLCATICDSLVTDPSSPSEIVSKQYPKWMEEARQRFQRSRSDPSSAARREQYTKAIMDVQQQLEKSASRPHSSEWEIEPLSGPVEQPSVPVEQPSVPVEPTSVPAEPTSVPVEPTSVPVEPTSAPIEPTSVPVALPTAPVEPPKEIAVDTSRNSAPQDVTPQATASSPDVEVPKLPSPTSSRSTLGRLYGFLRSMAGGETAKSKSPIESPTSSESSTSSRSSLESSRTVTPNSTLAHKNLAKGKEREHDYFKTINEADLSAFRSMRSRPITDEDRMKIARFYEDGLGTTITKQIAKDASPELMKMLVLSKIELLEMSEKILCANQPLTEKQWTFFEDTEEALEVLATGKLVKMQELSISQKDYEDNINAISEAKWGRGRGTMKPETDGAKAAFQADQFACVPNDGGGSCLFHSLEGRNLAPVEVLKLRERVAEVLIHKKYPGETEQQRKIREKGNAHEVGALPEHQQKLDENGQVPSEITNEDFANTYQKNPRIYAGDMELQQWLELSENRNKTVFVVDCVACKITKHMMNFKEWKRDFELVDAKEMEEIEKKVMEDGNDKWRWTKKQRTKKEIAREINRRAFELAKSNIRSMLQDESNSGKVKDGQDQFVLFRHGMHWERIKSFAKDVSGILCVGVA